MREIENGVGRESSGLMCPWCGAGGVEREKRADEDDQAMHACVACARTFVLYSLDSEDDESPVPDWCTKAMGRLN